MGRPRRYIAGESSRRIVRKLTIANLAVMLALFALCLVFLNMFTQQTMTAQTDERLERDLFGFSQSHQSPEEHSQRLPSGLLPIIFFYDEGDGYVNPHPADYMIAEDTDAILARGLPDGYSTQTIHGRTYRIYRVENETPLRFWEQGQSYIVTETVSFVDITPQKAMVDSLRLASILSLLASVVVFGVFCYRQARKSIVPITEAWDKQRQFAADTSHELRNPLAVVQTNAELLLANPNHTIEQESKHVAAILDSSHRMASMLSTLLTLARADADLDEVTYEQLDMSRLLEDLCVQFEQIGSLKGIRMSHDIEPEITLSGDRERLTELFSVLLDNALRYTEPGKTVRLTCRVERGCPCVRVEDTGIGIAEDELESIFQRFYRNDRARFINPEGTGLGLSIAQWIVDRHEAELSVTSVEGEGSCFAVAFPEQEKH